MSISRADPVEIPGGMDSNSGPPTHVLFFENIFRNIAASMRNIQGEEGMEFEIMKI